MRRKGARIADSLPKRCVVCRKQGQCGAGAAAADRKRLGATRRTGPDREAQAYIKRLLCKSAKGRAAHARRSGEAVGEDEYGNKYYRERGDGSGADGKERRWVVYNGYADASRVPSEWHGWLHHTFDVPPSEEPLPRRPWEQDHLPNLTGTLHAYRPTGSLAEGSDRRRQQTAADYESWTPGD